MRLWGKSRSSRAGFTVIELLLVLLVLGVLLGILARTFLGARDRARQNATLSDMRTIATAIESYMIDYNMPPPAHVDFTQVAKRLQPYNNNFYVPAHDHWGHLFDYERGSRSGYTLISYGKDGLDGLDITEESRYEFERDIVLSNGLFRTWPGKLIDGFPEAVSAAESDADAPEAAETGPKGNREF